MSDRREEQTAEQKGKLVAWDFCTDPDSSPEKLVFNRTVGLRDTWAKIQKQQKNK